MSFVFINRNGGVNFRPPNILQNRSHDACERDNEAPLERRVTTHIPLDVRVRSHTFMQAAEILIHSCRHPSQWPGYSHWAHDITTRDRTVLLVVLGDHGPWIVL